MDLSAQLNELQRAVGRIEGGISSLKDSMDEHVVDHKELVKRVSKLELWRSGVVGAWTVVGSIAGYLFKSHAG